MALFSSSAGSARQRHLAGMLANLYLELHLPDLVEQGCKVPVVRTPQLRRPIPSLRRLPRCGRHFGFVANPVLTTDETVRAMDVTSVLP